MKLTTKRLKRLIQEELRKVLNEADSIPPKIHFMDWLIAKTKRVHSKPGQGSIFATQIEKVVEDVKEIAALAKNVESIASSTGVLEATIPGIGYDLVARVKNGVPIDKNGRAIEGEETIVKKEEGRGTVDVQAIKTSRPLSDFETDRLTIIIRPMKEPILDPETGEKIMDPETDRPKMKAIPNEYIVLSVFPGTTGADLRASDWEGKYMVVIPKNRG